MDETTTTETVEQAGADNSTTVATATEQDASAVAKTDNNAQTEQSTETKGEPTSSLPEVDDKLQKYADSHGLTLDSESSIKAAKMAMDNQAEFHRNRQSQKKLDQEMLDQVDANSEAQATQNGTDPELIKRLNKMEAREEIRAFWDENPGARAHEDAIRDKLLNAGIYGSPKAVLSAAYAMVRAENSATLKTEGGREALETLAGKQRATAVRGNAVATAPATKTEDPFLKGLTSND